MPRHVMIMWLLAGGGTLIGASLTYLATHSNLATARVRSSWHQLRSVLPTVSFRKGHRGLDRHTPSASLKLAPTGSTAFDEYRIMQLAKLEREEREFRDFLQRLRDARDREEFDAFVKEAKSGSRRNQPTTIENAP